MEMDPFLRRTRVWISALVVCGTLFCSSCGTIITRTVGPNWTPPEPTLPRIYSGTIFDCTCFLHPEMHDTHGIGGFCLIDVPFSIIADTVMLPLTIYEQVKYGSYASGEPTGSDKRPEQ